MTFTQGLGGGGSQIGGYVPEVGQTGYKYPDETAEGGGPRIAGYYQSTNPPYKYYHIQANPIATGDEPGGDPISAPCPCSGAHKNEDRERVCNYPCQPPTCGSVYPQQTQTSRTSGDFYILLSGVYDNITRPAFFHYFPLTNIKVSVWSEENGQDDLRVYDAVMYGVRESDGKYYTKINLADHPGIGTIYISAYFSVWGNQPAVNCPATNFVRLSYITGYVYYDPSGTCSASQPWTQTTDLGVGYNDGGATTAGSVQSSGEYAGMYVVSSNTGANVSLQLLNKPDEYICSDCNASSCPNKASVAPGSNNNNFFLTDQADPWWQVTGAGIYAGGRHKMLML